MAAAEFDVEKHPDTSSPDEEDFMKYLDDTNSARLPLNRYDSNEGTHTVTTNASTVKVNNRSKKPSKVASRKSSNKDEDCAPDEDTCCNARNICVGVSMLISVGVFIIALLIFEFGLIKTPFY